MIEDTSLNCEGFYDEHEMFNFTPMSDEIEFKITVDHDLDKMARIFLDNIELKVASAPVMAYYYNDRGHRIRKEHYASEATFSTYYVRDISGQVMGIYTKSVESGGETPEPRLAENPVYGSSRLGIMYRGEFNDTYAYQLTDHLGNVRAVVVEDEQNNAISITNKTDYYPGGMPMPNRNVEGEYRYGYQGDYAEKEDIGSTNSFELRLYDARINRWMTPDPYGQFHSPYLGMGNNPINGVDPDGGVFIRGSGITEQQFINWKNRMREILGDDKFNFLNNHRVHIKVHFTNEPIEGGRLNSANYLTNYAMNGSFTGENEDYFEGDITYDKNGNILSLTRKGATVSNTIDIIDDLDYDYNFNQLSKVDDTGGDNGFKDGTNSGNDYTYDDNGNMIKDENKDIINIDYNHLNLPKKVTFKTSSKYMQKYIKYTYDATGVKLQKEVREDTPTLSVSPSFTKYSGAYIYEQATMNSPSLLKFISHPEGYVEPTLTTSGVEMDYVYQYKDHLGNIRLSYRDKNQNDDNLPVDLEIVEENNYYPFGLKHDGYNKVINGQHYPYGYNGKEENNELGLEWLDFGARNYDASLGRWMNLDPLAEMMRRHSPYNYAFDNPVYFIDPDGMAPEEGLQDSYGNDLSTAAVDYYGPTISFDLPNGDTSPLIALNSQSNSLNFRLNINNDEKINETHIRVKGEISLEISADIPSKVLVANVAYQEELFSAELLWSYKTGFIMNINIANSNTFLKSEIGVKLSENFCVFCLSNNYNLKTKQNEVTFSEGPFNLNFADGSVSFTLAQHKVKLGMFTANGEISVENIDKGDSKLPNRNAGGLGATYENNRRQILGAAIDRDARSEDNKVKKDFYDSLKRLR